MIPMLIEVSRDKLISQKGYVDPDKIIPESPSNGGARPSSLDDILIRIIAKQNHPEKGSDTE